MAVQRRDFGRLWGAQAISNLGDGVRSVAFPWLASLLTRDPLFIALVGAATQAAWIVFPLVAGGLADRFERKRIIALSLTAQFIVTSLLAAVVFMGRDSLGLPSEPIVLSGARWWLVLLAVAGFVLSLSEVLRDVAAQAFLPDLVEGEWLETANGRLFAAETVTERLIGPPLGGLLLAASVWIPFGFDAATFVLSAVLVGSISKRSTAAPRDSLVRMRSQVGDAIRWLWNHRILRSMTLALTVNNFLNALAFTTFVLFVQEVIGLGAVGFALISTGGAIAGVAASVTASTVIERLGRGRLMVTIPVVSALTLIATGLTSSGWVVWLALIPTFFLGTVWSVLSRSLRQRLTPNDMQGRVTGAHRTLNFGFLPVGSLVGGAIVAVVEAPIGREWALRAPFFVAAAGLLLLVPFVRHNLSESAISDALA
ncbi:MAG: MFS transporter [Acidimicrobiia bacterium]